MIAETVGVTDGKVAAEAIESGIRLLQEIVCVAVPKVDFLVGICSTLSMRLQMARGILPTR